MAGLGSGRSALLFFSFEGFVGGVENSVQKTGGFFGGKFLREFERFVDDDFYGRGAEAQLKNRKAQNVAIDSGKPLEAPVLRKARNQTVSGVCFGDGTFEELIGKFARIGGRTRGFPKMLLHLRGFLARHVPFKKHLQCKLARFMAEGHLVANRAARVDCRKWDLQRQRGPAWKLPIFLRCGPFRLPRRQLHNLCYRPSAQRGRSPARACRRRRRKKSLEFPCQFARAEYRAMFRPLRCRNGRFRRAECIRRKRWSRCVRWLRASLR